MYTILIDQDEDGIFVSECCSLPGCISQGKTGKEALENIQDAIRGYLESLDKHGGKTVHINKRNIVDEQGNPKEVVIPMEDFRKIEELLDLDLDEEAVNQLRQARKDRESGNEDAYADLDSI